ncbi:alpha/beta-hydrolase [Annulohypoxylon truncatum]|uniref:alpha/beta-hydrolase n=1 Tax=Annulohypoxylon truncatum TaxID=327061 RepID=UPI002008BB67|nr:alpha/beta-hydrolase [Annulohypoxylon truncatum]KAI1205839.1 alpha/beta-hydrolase [Annulohypoxylon truncatum]
MIFSGTEHQDLSRLRVIAHKMNLFRILITGLSVASSLASQGLPVQYPFDSSHAALIGKNTWRYFRARPSNEPKGTVLLLHGFPDLPYGWKYQVPLFTSLGYQVIVPEMLGYGRTSSPAEFDAFSFKNVSDDLAVLLDQIVPGEQVILGGHDWGGGLVWPFATLYPDLFKAIFSITYPYIPPVTEYVDLADQIAANKSLNFKYQLQFRDPSFDRRFRNETEIHQFLLAMYYGATPDGKQAFSTNGVDLDLLPYVQQPSLLNDTELDQYVSEYQLQGLRGPVNWYRTAKINFEDELPTAKAGHKFTMPSLFIQALQDPVLIPSLSVGMDQYFDKLTRADVNTSHWAMIQAPNDVNAAIQSWLATFN